MPRHGGHGHRAGHHGVHHGMHHHGFQHHHGIHHHPGIHHHHMGMHRHGGIHHHHHLHRSRGFVGGHSAGIGNSCGCCGGSPSAGRIVCNILSLIIAIPLIVVGALMIADIWQNSSLLGVGIGLVIAGAMSLLGGLMGLVMTLCGICATTPVQPVSMMGGGVPAQSYEQMGLPTETPYPASPLKPPEYATRQGPVLPSVYQQEQQHQSSVPTVVISPTTNQNVQNGGTNSGNDGALNPMYSASPPPRYYSPSPAPNNISTSR